LTSLYFHCSEDRCCSCTGVQCGPLEEPPYFRCGACPPGSTGNGTTCHDLDEVSTSDCCQVHEDLFLFVLLFIT
jgi:syndecan 4